MVFGKIFGGWENGRKKEQRQGRIGNKGTGISGRGGRVQGEDRGKKRRTEMEISGK